MHKRGGDKRWRHHRRPIRLAAILAASVPLAGVVLAPAAAATATTTSVAASANPMAGVAVTLTATVAPVPGGGRVAFRTPAGTIYGCAAVAVSTTTGRARCTTTFSGTGRVTITARYGGSSGFSASSGSRAITIAARVPSFVGSLGSCTATTGALVAVDFGPWRGPIVRGCGLHPASGLALLTGSGFTTTGDQRDGPTFVCRIGHPAVDNGRQYPTPAQDPCVVTPPAAAYWAYWIAAAGSNTWQFSTLGAASYRPKQGEVDAWVYGGTPIGASGQRPTFSPNQARAGLPGSGAPAGSGTGPAGSGARANPSATALDLVAGARYVATTRTPTGDPSGTSLGADGYAQSFSGFADYGLTIDGAFALAAAGTDDAALRTVAAFVDQRRTDSGGRSVDAWTGYGTRYADGGSIAKEALLAEVTGFDPRAFGGHDLIAALEALVCTGADAGAGCAAAGNFAYATSTFSQALGVIALIRAGVHASALTAAVAYLQAVRHADGSWPSLLPASADSDVDSTAMAATALALRSSDPAAESAVRAAAGWLAAHQHADGGFAGAAGESTNSTGLAVQGLRLAGATYRTQTQRALEFLAARQNSDGGFAVAASGAASSDLRASAQAVSGAVGTPLGTLFRDVSAPDSGGADPAAAARYLVSRLVDGNHVEFPGGFGPNYGGTADVAFALAAAGDQDGPLKAVVDYLAEHVAEYADPAGTTPKFPGPYSGAAAKLALVAEVTALSPRAFGGYDLLGTLTDHVCTAADSSGACTARGDFYQAFSTVSQALGVLALARAGVAVPASALTRLLELQCPDGGFSSELITHGQTCTPDPDTTGYAVQALVLLPAGAPAVARAVTYLRDDQQSDGGYMGTAGENVNTTAVATEALLAHGATPADQAVTSALRWLGTRQNPDGGLGISAQSPGSDVSATAQALPAVVGMTLTTLLHPLPSGPRGTPTPTPTGSGTSTIPGPPTPSSSEPPSLAMTGTDAGRWFGYAVLLLTLGTLACLAARRRALFPALGRHARPRHAGR
jgi:prenyltransferase beta subunit